MAVSYSNKHHWYLFLLFPFLTAFLALKNFRAPWAKNIIWAFTVFYGFTFGLAGETSSGNNTSDVFRYVSEVKVLHEKKINFEKVINLYKQNEDIDILKLTLAIVISRFTDSQQLLLAVYGLIFGFFFSRNIWFVLDRLNGKIKTTTFILLAAYFLVIPFWGINSFRFSTATHVFLYGLLLFFYDGKKKSLWICSFSVLVHFSFLLPVMVLGIYLLCGNKTLVYFIFFLISTVTSEINLVQFNNLVDTYVPESFAERSATYRDEEYVENFREGTEFYAVQELSWHVKYFYKALYWPLMTFLFILFFKLKNRKLLNDKYLSSLSFIFLFWAVANIMNTLPSGRRFLVIASLLALPLVIFYVQNLPNEKYLNKRVLIASPALFLFIIVSLRIGFYSFSLNTVLSNFFLVLVTDYNIALNDLIK